MANVTHGDAQDLLDAFKRGWASRDPDTIMALFDAQADYRAEPFSEPLIGANAIRAYWNEIAQSHVHVDFEAEHTWVSGSAVLSSWHAAYTRRRTAERVRAYGFMTLELNDERLVQRFRCWPVERVVGRDATYHPEGGQD